MLKYTGSLPDHIQDILKYTADWSVDENGRCRLQTEDESIVFESPSLFEKHTKDTESREIEIHRFLVIDLHSRKTCLSDNISGSRTPITVL